MKKMLCLFCAMSLALAAVLMTAGAFAEGSMGAVVTVPLIDLTPIFQAVIALLAALITRKLIPWINARTTAAQQSKIRALIKTLVFAAEQIYGAGKGSEKMQYVCNQLRARGYDVDMDEIEAAVGEYLNGCTKLDASTESETIIEYDDGELPPIDDWPLEMIVEFFRINGIPCDGCQTKDDYIRAITQACNTEPSDVVDEFVRAATQDGMVESADAVEESAPGA